MSVDIARLRKLVDAFEASDWDDIHLKGEDFEIRLSTSAEVTAVEAHAPARAIGAVNGAPNGEAVAPVATVAATVTPDGGIAPVTSSPEPAANGTHTGAAGEAVTSPSVGIFWRAPSPTSPPFVEVGEAVSTDSTLCIVEVMKLMTQVTTTVPGRIVDVLVANGEAVQKDQHLFTIVPD
jgi:acetyl-CoA carboxylase biotin carboxyl carrier protein